MLWALGRRFLGSGVWGSARCKFSVRLEAWRLGPKVCCRSANMSGADLFLAWLLLCLVLS